MKMAERIFSIEKPVGRMLDTAKNWEDAVALAGGFGSGAWAVERLTTDPQGLGRWPIVREEFVDHEQSH